MFWNAPIGTMKITLFMPCHNEEKGLGKSLEAALVQTRPLDQIVVVNDGSTDNTKKILTEFSREHKLIKAVNLRNNTGNKSKAQEKGLSKITGDITIMTDGDTVLDEQFVEQIERIFSADEDGRIAAVCGQVKSMKYNWVTAFRAVDYTIGFDVFKQAQSILGYVFVMPGCATAIRTDVLKQLSFNHDTVTEDLDFTYQIHLMGMRIIFEEKAIVYTQDPPNLKSYIRQMRRWYGGGWQNLVKYYSIVFKNPIAAVELTLMFGEGLLYSMFLFFVLFMYPLFFFMYIVPAYFVITFLFAVYSGIKNRRLDLILFSPTYIFFSFLNAGLTIFEFFNEVVFRRKNLVWLKADRV